MSYSLSFDYFPSSMTECNICSFVSVLRRVDTNSKKFHKVAIEKSKSLVLRFVKKLFGLFSVLYFVVVVCLSEQ